MYRVYQLQRLNNSSNQDIQDLVYFNVNRNGAVKEKQEKNDLTRLELPRQRRLIQCLHYIDDMNDKRAKNVEKKDIKSLKELQNFAPIVRYPPSNIKLGKKLDMWERWRHDPDRWITVSALSHSLHTICCMHKYKTKSKSPESITIFHSPSAPDISLSAYLHRIAWYLPCPTACFVLALEYIFRLTHQCPKVIVNDNSVHQILITCIMIAAKFIDDKLFKNTFYARLAGLPVINISTFEVKLMFFLKFNLHVLPQQYNARYKAMLANNQGPNMVVIRREGNNF